MLGDPQAGQCLDGLHGLLGVRLGMRGTKKAADIRLGWIEHGAIVPYAAAVHLRYGYSGAPAQETLA
ncbi:hypothetical protein GCM10027032_04750 [Simplicispira piscis]